MEDNGKGRGFIEPRVDVAVMDVALSQSKTRDGWVGGASQPSQTKPEVISAPNERLAAAKIK